MNVSFGQVLSIFCLASALVPSSTFLCPPAACKNVEAKQGDDVHVSIDSTEVGDVLGEHLFWTKEGVFPFIGSCFSAFCWTHNESQFSRYSVSSKKNTFVLNITGFQSKDSGRYHLIKTNNRYCSVLDININVRNPDPSCQMRYFKGTKLVQLYCNWETHGQERNASIMSGSKTLYKICDLVIYLT